VCFRRHWAPALWVSITALAGMERHPHSRTRAISACMYQLNNRGCGFVTAGTLLPDTGSSAIRRPLACSLAERKVTITTTSHGNATHTVILCFFSVSAGSLAHSHPRTLAHSRTRELARPQYAPLPKALLGGSEAAPHRRFPTQHRRGGIVDERSCEYDEYVQRGTGRNRAE
jgi:hypothetical protein